MWDLMQQGPLPISPPEHIVSSTGAAAAAAAAASDSDSDAGVVVDDEDLELEAHALHSCHPRLTCARQVSPVSGINDETGLAGLVCSHGVPLLGSVLAMPAPERFLYYDLLLLHVLEKADVEIFFLDIGCTYAKHVRLYLPNLDGLGIIKLPWWHARGHGSACYVKNSGLYLSGVLC